MDVHGSTWICIVFMDLHCFPCASRGPGARMFYILCHYVASCRTGLDPPFIKISDSGGLDLEAWCLDVWMLARLKWIAEGD